MKIIGTIAASEITPRAGRGEPNVDGVLLAEAAAHVLPGTALCVEFDTPKDAHRMKVILKKTHGVESAQRQAQLFVTGMSPAVATV